MSRLDKQKVNVGLPHGFGFEIGRCICGVLLKKVNYEEVNGFKKMKLHFFKNNIWITRTIILKPKNQFEDVESYKSHKMMIVESIENLMNVYMSPDNMVDTFKMTKGLGLKGFTTELVRRLKLVNYTKTEVCIKVIPKEDGGRYVGFYPPFMNKEKDKNYILKYSRDELWKFNKYKK